MATHLPRLNQAKPLADTAAVRSALVDARTSAEALRAVYRLRKGCNRKYSLAFFCRAAGIPSTGYLSDVFSGKRLLALKYRQPLLAALGLKGELGRFVRLLAECDGQAFGPKRLWLARRVDLARKVLRISRHPAPRESASFFEAIDVFCAFSLFPAPPSEDDLATYFGEPARARTAAALQTLIDLGLIEAKGERFIQRTNHVIFGENVTGVTHLDFLRDALAKASSQVDHWFNRKDEAFLSSSVLSVRREDYLEHLARLRHTLVNVQAELETGQADLLIRFNVQIFPVTQTSPSPRR